VTFRVGWGYDAHRLDGQPPLLLAGVVVSESVGVNATSDGDIVAHALTDAILGACAAGDIGEHFPSSDPASQGADSMRMLAHAVDLCRTAGFSPESVDVTVIAEDIRIAPHRGAMAASLAAVLGLGPASVSVKCTSTDGLGFIGRGEGLAAVAMVTVTAIPNITP
jgi:2-C-methyl-D-erythritol 4-phosphate cytidylyltransferase/2-C-methyl-D-erythritol 2,4-cyclodiphosphate synthase